MRRLSAEAGSPTAVPLFSGAGGFCEGVRLAGFAGMCDRDGRIRCADARRRIPQCTHVQRDVSRFLLETPPGVPFGRDLIDGDVDLVFGRPTCQGFSQIGPRDLKETFFTWNSREDPAHRVTDEFATGWNEALKLLQTCWVNGAGSLCAPQYPHQALPRQGCHREIARRDARLQRLARGRDYD